VDLYVHRTKAFFYVVGPLLFGGFLLAIAVADGAPWWIWAAVPGCLAVSGVFLWRYLSYDSPIGEITIYWRPDDEAVSSARRNR
jgi:hypothetical protein